MPSYLAAWGLALGSVVGCSCLPTGPGDDPPPPDDLPPADAGTEPRPAPRCANPATSNGANFAIGMLTQQRTASPPLEVNGTVVDAAEASFPFNLDSTLAPPSTTEVIAFSTADNMFKVAMVDDTGAGLIVPPGRWLPGDAVHFYLSTADGGGGGGFAFRLDSEQSHLAGVLWGGAVGPPMDEATIRRGPPEGPVQSTDCGTYQEDSFEVDIDGTTHHVSVRTCVEIGDFVFLGLQAFHPLTTVCTDQIAPVSWMAAWP